MRRKVADSMADPKVCVALDGTTVEEMTDEAAANPLAQTWSKSDSIDYTLSSQTLLFQMKKKEKARITA